MTTEQTEQAAEPEIKTVKKEDPLFFRFIVHLPIYDNDNKPIDPAIINNMLKEIKKKFGGLTKTPHLGNPGWQGYYVKDGEVYEDRVCILHIDAPQGDEALKFFKRFQQKYKVILKQLDFYIVYHEVFRVE